MPRAALSALLLSLGACLRVDPGQQGDELPEKKFGGPERPRCSPKQMKSRPTQEEQIVGGTYVDGVEFPYLAWIGDDDGTMLAQNCGGSLITDRVVLTAGHCLYPSNWNNARTWVRLNLTDFRESLGVARAVINWRKHPRYNARTVDHDLALLLLNESVPADVVEPLRLSDGTRPFEHGGDKVLAGWGSMDEGCRRYQNRLRKAQLPMGEDGVECSTAGSKKLTPMERFDHLRQCCAGNYFGDIQYPGCGDSGGPLVAVENGTAYQVGLVSWSYGVPWPDVFTRVSYYRDWIADAAKDLESEGVHPSVKAKWELGKQ